MESVLDILLQIQNTSGTNDKLDILKQNINNQNLKDILYYTYNPFYVYGISTKKIEKDLGVLYSAITDNFNTVIDLFKYLRVNNTGNNSVCAIVQNFINNQPDKYKQLYKDIITKDLTLGVNVKSINKVWKDLIPVYEVQQGERLHDNLDRIYNDNLDIIITQKFDGQRCSARVQDGNVLLYSRNGKVYEGLHELETQLAQLPNGMYDGELLLNYKPNKQCDLFETIANVTDNMVDGIYVPQIESKELFKKTASIVNSDLEDKKNINIWLYDCTSLNSFDTFTDYKQPTSYRKSHLEQLINNLDNCPNIKNTPILYQGKMNEDVVNKLLDRVIALGQEGLMINIASADYEYKRSKNMLKVKKMYTVDLKVIDVEEGSGLNKGKVGALVVNYKGFNVSVGSGLTKEQREQWWINKQDILGKIIEVQYFEETTNKKDESVSLRFPVFKQVRLDKTEESYF